MAKTIKVTDETHKFLSSYAKDRGHSVNECADELIDYAKGRLEALERYKKNKKGKAA